MNGRFAKKELKKLKLLIGSILVWTAVLLLEVLLLHTGFLSDVCMIGVFVSLAAVIAVIFRSIKASETDDAERIIQAGQFLENRFGKDVKAQEVQIQSYERQNHPFYSDHKIKGNLEICGQLRQKTFLCRELYIYDITHKRGSQHPVHNKKFSGTTVQWQEPLMDGEYIICSENFFKQAVYHFERQGFEKKQITGCKEILFVKGTANERTVRYLYERFRQAVECFLKPLDGWELCLWYRDGKAEIYICQLLSARNEVRVLVDAVERFLRTLV